MQTIVGYGGIKIMEACRYYCASENTSYSPLPRFPLTRSFFPSNIMNSIIVLLSLALNIYLPLLSYWNSILYSATTRSFFLPAGNDKAYCSLLYISETGGKESEITWPFKSFQLRQSWYRSELASGKIFLEIAQLLEESNRYHPVGLTTAFTINCSLKPEFASLSDKALIHPGWS